MNPLRTARRFFTSQARTVPDSDLLARFVAGADAEAFALLVRRFGPLVLGTCRRVLGPTDADDAFQAVFLTFARRAGTIRDAAALPAWLHRVSLRIARKALARRPHVAPLPEAVADPADPFAEMLWKDVRRVLDEELDRLPQTYRGPVVLCWLEGLTQDEAATRLGVSLATLKRRLDAGRERLRARLLRRGVGPALAAVAVLDPAGLRSAVPPDLVAATARLTGPGAVPPGVGSLLAASGSAARLLALAAVVVGVSIVVGVPAGPPAPATPLAASDPSAAPPPRPATPAEPLPKGVTARLGGLDFRTPDEIHASARSPDGTLLAVAESFSVRVFEAATWKPVHRFPADAGHGTWGYGDTMAFSPDGRHLAFVGNGEAAYVWDLRENKLTNRFDGERWRWLPFCGFTTDNLLTLADDRRLYFYDPATGREVRSVPVTGRVVAVSPDGAAYVRLAKSDNPVRPSLVETTTGKTLHEFEPLVVGPHVSRDIAFSPDGKTMALLPATGAELHLWDVAGRTKTVLATPPPRNPAARGGMKVGFSPDGKTIWLQLYSGDIVRWDAATRPPLPPLKMADGPVPSNLHIPPGGQALLTPTRDGWVRRWDAATGAEIPVPGRYGNPTRMALSADGALLAVGEPTGRIDLLEATTGKLVRTLREQGEPVHEMVFDRSGGQLAVGELRRLKGEITAYRTRVIRVADGGEVRVLGEERKENYIGYAWPLGFSGDGKQLALDHWRDMKVWDVATGKQLRAFDRVGDRMALSPDGKTLAVEKDYDAVLIDTATGKEIGRCEVNPEDKKNKSGLVGVCRFAWSADGKTLAVGLPKFVVAVLDPATGREQRRFETPAKPWPPGRGTLEMFYVDRLRSFGAHLGLSPEGGRVAVAGANPWSVDIWDTATGRFLADLPHEFRVSQAAFTPDGKAVLTFGSGGLGYRWDLDAVIAAQKK